MASATAREPHFMHFNMPHLEITSTEYADAVEDVFVCHAFEFEILTMYK